MFVLSPRSVGLLIFSSHVLRESLRSPEVAPLENELLYLTSEISALNGSTQVFEACSEKAFWLVWTVKLSVLLDLFAIGWIIYHYVKREMPRRPITKQASKHLRLALPSNDMSGPILAQKKYEKENFSSSSDHRCILVFWLFQREFLAESLGLRSLAKGKDRVGGDG